MEVWWCASRMRQTARLCGASHVFQVPSASTSPSQCRIFFPLLPSPHHPSTRPFTLRLVSPLRSTRSQCGDGHSARSSSKDFHKQTDLDRVAP